MKLSTNLEYRFSEIQETLIELALVKRDKISRTFSLHRLVQTQFKFYISTELRQQAFKDTSKLLSYAFPQRDAKKGQYYDRWAECRKYLQHVLYLKECYVRDQGEKDRLEPNTEFCWVLVNCGRFLNSRS